MSVPVELLASARSTYRLLFRTAANTFKGDDRVLNAFREKIRTDFREGRSIVDPEAYAARIQLGREVAEVLKRNIVQGVKVSPTVSPSPAETSGAALETDGGIWRLRITEDTELGSNDSIKSEGGTVGQSVAQGQGHCQTSSGATSASAAAPDSDPQLQSEESTVPAIEKRNEENESGPRPSPQFTSKSDLRATIMSEIKQSLDRLDYDWTFFVENSRFRGSAEKMENFLSDLSEFLDGLELFEEGYNPFSWTSKTEDFMAGVSQLMEEYEPHREFLGPYEFERIERKVEFLRQVEKLLDRLLKSVNFEDWSSSDPKSPLGFVIIESKSFSEHIKQRKLGFEQTENTHENKIVSQKPNDKRKRRKKSKNDGPDPDQNSQRKTEEISGADIKRDTAKPRPLLELLDDISDDIETRLNDQPKFQNKPPESPKRDPYSHFRDADPWRKHVQDNTEPSAIEDRPFDLFNELGSVSPKKGKENSDGDHWASLLSGDEPAPDTKQQKKKVNYSALKRLSQNRVKPELDEEDIEESFVRGSGPGGQSINKTANNVQLLHKPTGIRVTCQETRSLQTNRMLARRKLLEKLDQMENPGLSKEDMKRAKQAERERRKKKKQRKKAKKRQEEEVEDDDDDED